MFIDASAIIAVLAEEADARQIVAKLDGATTIICSPLVRYEVVLGLARARWTALHGADLPMSAEFVAQIATIVDGFLGELGVIEQNVTTEIGTEAIRAAGKYGRGTGHLAKLNFGDCYSYAAAKISGLPLLFKGNDFIHTDIEAA